MNGSGVALVEFEGAHARVARELWSIFRAWLVFYVDTDVGAWEVLSPAAQELHAEQLQRFHAGRCAREFWSCYPNPTWERYTACQEELFRVACHLLEDVPLIEA